MNKIEQIYSAISADPQLLNELTAAEEQAAVTRAMPMSSQSSASETLRSILKEDISESEMNELLNELNSNQVVRLFKESDGTLDAKELLDYVGDLSGTSVSKDSPAVRALFDGKLELKEIILIILLLKLFKKKQTQTSVNTGSSLLSTLFSGSQQQSYGNNILNSLLSGSGSYNNAYGLYNNNYGSNSNSLLSLFGLGSSQNTNNAQNNLINFINGNNLSQAQLQQLYNQLNQSSSNAVYNNGQVNVSSLFSILNQLMSGR